jgi:hypothetical protein
MPSPTERVFFVARRWKAAVTLAVVTGSMLAARGEGSLFLLILFRPMEHSSRLLLVMWIQPLVAGFPVDWLFMVSFGVFLRFHSVSMNAILENVWPDPEKGRRSPIRDRW